MITNVTDGWAEAVGGVGWEREMNPTAARSIHSSITGIRHRSANGVDRIDQNAPNRCFDQAEVVFEPCI